MFKDLQGFEISPWDWPVMDASQSTVADIRAQCALVWSGVWLQLTRGLSIVESCHFCFITRMSSTGSGVCHKCGCLSSMSSMCR
jgi:hypothetical protein